MKNAFTLKTSWCILFLFLSIVLFGQKYSLSFQAKQGILAYENREQDYSNSDEFNITGGDISIGLNLHYTYKYSFFKERYIHGNMGVLWNYNSFARRKRFPFSGNVRTYRFQSHSIVFPISLGMQLHKMGFSTGFIFRYHLSTKLLSEKLIELMSPFDYSLLQTTYKAGEYIPSSPLNMGYGERAFLDDKIDVQFFFSYDFYLNDKFFISLEYRNLVEANYFNVESDVHSGIRGGFSRNYEFSSETISIGVNYKIF